MLCTFGVSHNIYRNEISRRIFLVDSMHINDARANGLSAATSMLLEAVSSSVG